MEILIIQSAWEVLDPIITDIVPKVRANYNGICTDVTNQPTENIPPDSNVFSCRFECDLATAEAIQADPDYYIQSWISDA